MDCRKCDTLLAIGKAKLANRDSLVEEQQYSINQLSQQFVLSQKLVILRDQQIKDINLHLKKETRKLKFTKFAWGATTVVLGGALVYFIIN